MADGAASSAEPRIAELTRQMLGELDDLADTVADVILRAEPAYAEQVPRADLVAHNRANLEAILGRVAGLTTSDLDTPRRTGRERAQQGLPLVALLRGYRLGSAFVWDELIRRTAGDPDDSAALLRYASTIWGLMDEYSEAISVAYRAVEAERELRDTQARDAAFDALLSGEVDGGQRLRECGRLLRLPETGDLVVVAAEALPRVAERLAVKGWRSAWRAGFGSQVGVVSLGAPGQPREVAALIELLGGWTEGRVGVSPVLPDLACVPGAWEQARLACSAATPGSQQVVAYDRAQVAMLLVSSPELADGLVRRVLGPVLALRPDEAELLLTTARAWFQQEGSTARTGQALHCHPNTVRNRLIKLEELTGHQLALPQQGAEMFLALEAHRLAGA